jgi:hypothetical protein
MTSALDHVELAVLAARGGDSVTAHDHIARAQKQTRTTARRERQIVEIAALVVSGDHSRAAGLATEHTREFPEDHERLTRLTPPS